MTELLEVQKAALKASDGKKGFAFFMEMGLGKTLTALTEFTDLVEQGEVTRLVVVCPNSFKSGWVGEITKQGINVDPWIYESGKDNHVFLRRRFMKPPVLVINYEAIRSRKTIEFIAQFIVDREAMIVFDESIQLKTYNSQQTKAGIELAGYFKYSRILSGKPITQGPHDLWGQMRAIRQLNGRNYFGFRNTFCRMGGWMNKRVTGVQNEEILGKLIDPHVFRAEKKDWIDLPPKLYTTRTYKMSKGQQARYDSMEEEFVAWLKTFDQEVTVDMAITKYIKLAQIQFGFLIDEDQRVHELVEADANPRIVEIKEIIDSEVTGKVVIVYHHRYSGEVLLKALADYNPTFIRGGMHESEITSNRDAFNKDPDCRVICIQTVAGRYGHTLIGGTEVENHCSTMIFAENTWSLDTRSQLEDRIHRIGQKGNSCLYVDLVGSSLDQKVVAALQAKQSIFDAVFAHIKSGK
jgi:SNF2 family DNA or RNA helicase